MLKGKTTSGFEFEIKEESLDDYELFECLCRVDKGDYSSVTEMVDMLLGEEQKNRLKEHIRKGKGHVSIKSMIDEVMEIFGSNDVGKN